MDTAQLYVRRDGNRPCKTHEPRALEALDGHATKRRKARRARRRTKTSFGYHATLSWWPCDVHKRVQKWLSVGLEVYRLAVVASRR